MGWVVWTETWVSIATRSQGREQGVFLQWGPWGRGAQRILKIRVRGYCTSFLVRLVFVGVPELSFSRLLRGERANRMSTRRTEGRETRRREDETRSLFVLLPWWAFLLFPRLHVRVGASKGAGADDRETGQGITPVLISFLTSRLGRQSLSPLSSASLLGHLAAPVMLSVCPVIFSFSTPTFPTFKFHQTCISR